MYSSTRKLGSLAVAARGSDSLNVSDKIRAIIPFQITQGVGLNMKTTIYNF